MAVRAESEEQLLEACLDVLSTEAVAGLQGLLSPKAIQEATRATPGAQGVSRHTAYRLWPDRGRALVDVASYLADPATNGALGMFATATHPPPLEYEQEEEARRSLTTDAEAAREVGVLSFRLVLGEHFALQLRSRSLVANWLLDAAAATSSPVWRGDRPPEATAALGREIIQVRAECYEEIYERWSDPVRRALSGFGRRPRPGLTVESITRLLFHLYEGFLHHLFADARVIDPDIDEATMQQRVGAEIDLASLAMFELAWSLTEAGTLADPRRPVFDPVNETMADTADMFDRVVDAAERLYTTADGVVDPADAAAAAEVAAPVAVVMFPDVGDLADSVLRRLVAGAGKVGASTKVSPLPMVRTALARLTSAASSHPALLAAAQAHPPTHPPDSQPLLEELGKAIADALRSPHVSCPDPDGNAQDLIAFALDGAAGWKAIEVILGLLGPAPRAGA